MILRLQPTIPKWTIANENCYFQYYIEELRKNRLMPNTQLQHIFISGDHSYSTI